MIFQFPYIFLCCKLFCFVLHSIGCRHSRPPVDQSHLPTSTSHTEPRRPDDRTIRHILLSQPSRDTRSCSNHLHHLPISLQHGQHHASGCLVSLLLCVESPACQAPCARRRCRNSHWWC